MDISVFNIFCRYYVVFRATLSFLKFFSRTSSSWKDPFAALGSFRPSLSIDHLETWRLGIGFLVYGSINQNCSSVLFLIQARRPIVEHSLVLLLYFRSGRWGMVDKIVLNCCREPIIGFRDESSTTFLFHCLYLMFCVK